MKIHKILYIEDNPDTAQAVKVILSSKDVKVETAYTGEEGLSKIKRERFDLVLLDIMLPDMSGWDIYERIKNKKIKISILSVLPISGAKLNDLRKERHLGYISKPFTKQELVRQVEDLLEE